MVTEILPGLYKVDVPLPKSPLKALNCYVFNQSERPLVIDTGFNHIECRQVLFSALAELNVNIAATDVVLTHMHPDHSGLVAELVSLGAKPFCSREDAFILNMPRSRTTFFQDYLHKCGFVDGAAIGSMLRQPSFTRSQEDISFQILEDGDILSVGGYELRCIKTPGHTPGHICLYEENKKILFSGDHILKDITPNISLWTQESNPLLDFMTHLRKISHLPVKLVLPGHRSIFTDCQARIAELLQNHEARAAEVVRILQRGARMTTLAVAKEMSWNLSYASFADFPLAQQLFATGEALAHLHYLEVFGKVARIETDGVYYFEVRV